MRPGPNKLVKSERLPEIAGAPTGHVPQRQLFPRAQSTMPAESQNSFPSSAPWFVRAQSAEQVVGPLQQQVAPLQLIFRLHAVSCLVREGALYL